MNNPIDLAIIHYIKAFFTKHFSATCSVKLIKIAELEIALHFAHPEVEEKYFSALSHLEVPSSANLALDVFIFDLHSLKTDQPLSQFVRNFFYQASGLKGQADDLPYTSESRLFYFHEIAYYYNERFKTALWIDSDTKSLGAPYWAHPLRFLLYDWLQCKGLQMTHVAAVSLNGKAALFCGDSGSGKSTLTVSCLMQDFNILGDDKCVVSLDSTPKVHSLYNTIKLFEKKVCDFKQFKADPKLSIETPLGVKSVFYLNSLYQDKMALCAPIKTIIKLQVNKDLKAPKLRLMSSYETAKHLSFSTISVCKWVNPAQVLKNLHALALKVPGYYLELAPQHEQNVELVKNVLSQ
jgi:hypothetical protein